MSRRLECMVGHIKENIGGGLCIEGTNERRNERRIPRTNKRTNEDQRTKNKELIPPLDSQSFRKENCLMYFTFYCYERETINYKKNVNICAKKKTTYPGAQATPFPFRSLLRLPFLLLLLLLLLPLVLLLLLLLLLLPNEALERFQ